MRIQVSQGKAEPHWEKASRWETDYANEKLGVGQLIAAPTTPAFSQKEALTD